MDDAVALTEDEKSLVSIDPGYTRASTASRLDSFILPDSLQFAEYNAESPAGLGYTETLAAQFERLEILARFRERFEARPFSLMSPMLDALLASYKDFGGTAAPPTIAIVDFREVPTWPEFEMLQAHFRSLGVPTIVCDPRELEFSGDALSHEGTKIDLVYRRVLINDILSRPDDCKALTDAYAARAVCVANTFRCKIPHKKAFFSVLTDDRFAGLFDAADRAHGADARAVDAARRRGGDDRGEADIDLVPHIRANARALVMKPNDEYGGVGVTLGWECSEAEWDETLDKALGAALGAWVVQEKIHVRRELFPRFVPGRARRSATCWWTVRRISFAEAGGFSDATQRRRDWPM